KGTLKCQLEVYPSTLADLQKGLEGLLREPGGCFEQTSTANYPNLLILDYMRESNQVDPQLEQKARLMLSSGYQKLTSSESRAPAEVTDAYIVWSITESGQDDDVEKELSVLNEKALTSKDSYFIALVANSLLNRSKSKEGLALLTKLTEQQKDDGHLDAGSTS